MKKRKLGSRLTNEDHIKFKIWLFENELTQASFSELVNVSPSYISKIFNNKVKLSTSIVKMFCKGGYKYYETLL